MSDEQLDDLTKTFGKDTFGEDTELNISSANVTFPAEGKKAAEEIVRMIPEKVSGVHSIEVVCGVFPAHVALSLVKMRDDNGPVFNVLIPVSVPAPAVEGEVRGGGFLHHHWEFH